MMLSLLWLLFLLQPAYGDISTKLKPHYSGNLRTTCDTLPYRTVYHETQSEANCYFVIEADVDSVRTTEKCSRVQKGAKLAGKVPDSVFTKVFANRSEFLRDGESTGKKMKAMCVYGSRFPCAAGMTSSDDSGTCIRPEEKNIHYRILGFYRVNFTQKVVPGQTIVVRGMAKGYTLPKRFSLDLRGEPSGSIWHLRMWSNRDPGRKIWLITYVNNVCKFKQTHPNPFADGVAYEVRIRVLEDRFHISINEKEYEYKHILPISTITHLIVGSVAEGSYVSYVDLGEKISKLYPPPRAMSYNFPMCKEAQCNRRFCRSLVITGIFDTIDNFMFYPNDFQFYLVLKNGDIALCFKASLNTKVVAMNSKKNGKWQTQLTEKKMPFKRKTQFTITITTSEKAFEIAVNGEHFSSFAHRFPPGDISRIESDGISDIDFQIK